MKTIRYIITCALSSVLLSSIAFASTVTTPKIYPRKLFIGDTLTYKVTVPLDKAASISVPLLNFTANNTADNTIEITTPQVTVRGSKLTYQVAITPYETGSILIPTLTIQNNLIRSISINVLSVIPKGVTANLKPMKPPVNTYADVWLLFYLALFSILGYAAYRYVQKRIESGELTLPFLPKPRSPQEIWQEYFYFFNNCSPEQYRSVKEFYLVTSEHLKKFFRDLLNIDLLDRTTSEITQSVLAQNINKKDVLLQALTHADLVKFAKYIPDATEISEYKKQLVTIIEAHRPGVPLTEDNK